MHSAGFIYLLKKKSVGPHYEHHDDASYEWMRWNTIILFSKLVLFEFHIELQENNQIGRGRAHCLQLKSILM